MIGETVIENVKIKNHSPIQKSNLMYTTGNIPLSGYYQQPFVPQQQLKSNVNNKTINGYTPTKNYLNSSGKISPSLITNYTTHTAHTTQTNYNSNNMKMQQPILNIGTQKDIPVSMAPMAPSSHSHNMITYSKNIYGRFS
jgi:hypothetical protein